MAIAFTLALVLSGLAAPTAGRLVDRGHGRLLLAGSALAGGLLVGALAFVQTPAQFLAVWLGIGLAMAGALYEPCFAFLTHTRGSDARRAITLVTLVAGFASTLSFPLGNAVASEYGWRTSAFVFAGLICFVAVPLFWIGAGAHSRAVVPPPRPSGRDRAFRAALRRPTFWFLTLAFALFWLNHGMLVTHLLPMLAERGVPLATAVLAASLLGPMQVAGRVTIMLLERRLSVAAVIALALAMLVVASACLLGAKSQPTLLFVGVAFQGAGIGVASITRPVVTAEFLGVASFGAISGAIALPVMLAMAVAPTVGARIWTWGGYDDVLYAGMAIAALALVSFGTAVATRRIGRQA